MKNAWVLMLGFFIVVPAYAQQTDTAYDEHGKHDPFLPLVAPGGAIITYDSDLTVGDMILEGIISDPQGNGLAIINGKVVKVGDKVGSYAVGVIGHDDVDLSKGQEHFSLKLKKGGS